MKLFETHQVQTLVKLPALFLLTIGHLKDSLCSIRVPFSRVSSAINCPGCIDDTFGRRITNSAHTELYIVAQYSTAVINIWCSTVILI